MDKSSFVVENTMISIACDDVLTPVVAICNDDDNLRRLLMGPDYLETSDPTSNRPGDHFLNLIDASRYFLKNSPSESRNFPPEKEANSNKTKLFCCLNIYQLESINAESSVFGGKVRVYLMWQFDWDDAANASVKAKCGEKAKEKTYYSLSDLEVADFIATHDNMPQVKLFNAIDEVHEDGNGSIRLYYGPNGGMIMWNYATKATFKEIFHVRHFPFDDHRLRIELQQDSSRTWDTFDLTVCNVLMHRTALEQQEWTIRSPKVMRGSPSHRTSYVHLTISRKSSYYTTNIFAIVVMIAFMSFFCFLVPVEEIANRVNIVITLILTTVAFKFSISNSVPKVGYSTHLDTYLFCSMFHLFFVATISAICNLMPYAFSNGIGLLIAVLEYISLNSWWFLSVHRGKRRDNVAGKTEVIDLLDEKRNWYSFSFCNVGFLVPPQTTIKNKEKNF